MVIRVTDLDNTPGFDRRIAELAADLTGHDVDKLAYVLIVTSFDSRGQTLFANTSEVSEQIALMLAVLHTMTRPWITGEVIQVVPTG